MSNKQKFSSELSGVPPVPSPAELLPHARTAGEGTGGTCQKIRARPQNLDHILDTMRQVAKNVDAWADVTHPSGPWPFLRADRFQELKERFIVLEARFGLVTARRQLTTPICQDHASSSVEPPFIRGMDDVGHDRPMPGNESPRRPSKHEIRQAEDRCG